MNAGGIASTISSLPSRKSSAIRLDLPLRPFANDEKTVDAVVRNLTVIGEAAQHIPTDIQARIAAIPWMDMRGMRHRIVHDYLAVDRPIVWRTVTEDLPPLIHLLRSLLST